MKPTVQVAAVVITRYDDVHTRRHCRR